MNYITEWLNKTSMTSLKEFVIIVLTFVVVFWFTVTASSMLVASPKDYFKEVPLMVNADSLKISMGTYLREANDYTEHSQNTGFNLAVAILAAIGLVKGINTFQHGKDRDTSKEKIREDGIAAAGIEKAKMEGQIAGTAAAAVAAQKVADAVNGHTTKEREALAQQPPAMQIDHADNVTQEVKDAEVRERE